MTTTATKSVTAEEFYDFIHRPENADRDFELFRGEIVEMTKPGKFHGFVCGNIAYILGTFVRSRKKGYVCANDTGILVDRDPDTVRGPDITLFEDDDISKKFAVTPASLVVEVLSPTDQIGKVLRRIQDQRRFGSPLVWLVDFEEKIVTVHRPGKEPVIVEENEELTGYEVLPDLRCKVADFFKMPGK